MLWRWPQSAGSKRSTLEHSKRWFERTERRARVRPPELHAPRANASAPGVGNQHLRHKEQARLVRAQDRLRGSGRPLARLIDNCAPSRLRFRWPLLRVRRKTRQRLARQRRLSAARGDPLVHLGDGRPLLGGQARHLAFVSTNWSMSRMLRVHVRNSELEEGGLFDSTVGLF